jgi:hypothetical protein
MQNKIVVAVRVLNAIHNRTCPVYSDLECLQSWISEGDREADADEMAYIVISAELELRRAERGGSSESKKP